MEPTALWRLVTSTGDLGLASLLRGAEPYTTVLSERFRRAALDARLRTGGRFYAAPRGAIYHGPGGMFYPYGVSHTVERHGGDELRDLIGGFVRLHSIMGCTPDVEALASTLGTVPRFDIDYRLLHLDHADFATVGRPPVRGLKVVRPRPEQWRRLLPLQLAYEIEEVLLPGAQANPAVSRSTLIESLSHQLVLVATYRSEVIARVATNARGYRNDQIGGVFTAPEWRGRGVARWLMGHLFAHLAADSHGASLFVKLTNEAAQELYRTLGFRFVSPFRISYYR